MYLPSGVTYYNKLTGNIMIGERPEDYRSYIKVHTYSFVACVKILTGF